MIFKKIKNHISHYGKRIMATALLCIFTTPIVANATEIVRSTRQTLKVNQISSPLGYIWDTNGNKFMFPAKKFSDGSLAYCLEHKKATPNGVTYNSGGNLDNGIAYIIQSQPNTGDWKKDYYVRQGAIHYYLGQSNWIKNAIGDIGLRNKIINLSNEAKKHKSISRANDLSITASPRMNDFKLHTNGYYETDWINVAINGDLTEYRMDIKNAPKGTQIVNGAGKVVTTLTKNDKKFYLRVPKANATNTDIKLRLLGDFSVKQAVEFIPVQSGYQKVTKLENRPVQQNDRDYITARLRPTGDFEVVKKNDEGKLLKGATFSIYNVDGVTKYRTQTTGENGKLKFADLIAGEYILREDKAPVGHVIKTKDTKIKVSSGITNTVNIVNNVIKGKLKIIKVDEENGDKLLEGAEFDIKDKTTDKIVDHVITDKNGEAMTKLLPYGEYYAQETKAPNGYVLNGKKYFATITENMQTVTIKAVNRLMKGSISIHKIDKETKEGLKGVEFNVLDDKNNVIETVVTDENGNAKTKELPIGIYSFVEVKGLDGYLIENTPIKVNITENKEYNFTVENEKLTGSMELLKLDADTKEPMKDVEFKVVGLDSFDKDKEFSLKTNEEGKATLGGLHKGKFKVLEVKTLDGYVLNTEPMEFEIAENGQLVKLEMTNKKLIGSMELLKLDNDTKEPMKDVEFKVVGLDSFDKDKEFNLKTNEEGKATLGGLHKGKFKVLEVKTLDGYVLNIEPMEFEIIENGQVVKLEMTNKKLTGSMDLLKLDNDTKEPMKDVEFKIVGLDSFDKDKEFNLKTNEEGKATLEGLHKGKFKLLEVKTLDGYILNTEPMEFEITENGQLVKLEMTNQIKKGSVKLLKVDEDTNRKLENAEFELHKINGEEDKVIGSYTSDENGVVSVDNLNWGDYYFKEVNAPIHYELSDKTYPFSIKEDKEVIEITVTNKVKTGEVEFSKTDVTTGENIDGAKIEITGIEEQNKHIKLEFDSSKEGNKFTLPEGKYEFKELQAPNGYVISTEVGTFEVKNGEVVTKAELKNKRIEGTLDFTKVDVSTGKPLDGAKIKIECLEGFDKGKVIEFTSSKEGNRFKLFAGKYKISETQAPSGYETTTETGIFEIKEEGQIIKCKLENKMIIKELPATGYTENIIFAGIGILTIMLGAFLVIRRNKNVRANK